MNKKAILDFLRLPRKEKRKYISLIPTAKHVGETNRRVWWIMTKKEVLHIDALLSWKKAKITPQKNTISTSIREILTLASSLAHYYESDDLGNWYQWNILDKIEQEMLNPWLALEFFLIDTLTRFSTWDVKISKSPREFDLRHKIDICSHLSRTPEPINLGIQLTTAESPQSWKRKEREMKDITTSIDRKKIRARLKWHKTSLIPHSAVLMIINWLLSKELNKKRGKGESNILREAFKKWRKKWCPNPWPISELPYKLKKQLHYIWGNFEEVLDEIHSFLLKKENLNKDTPYFLWKETRKHWYYIEYNSKEKTIEILVKTAVRKEQIRDKKPNGKIVYIQKNIYPEGFDYSLKLFITEDILKALWKEDIPEWFFISEEEKTPKKIGSKSTRRKKLKKNIALHRKKAPAYRAEKMAFFS